MTHYTSILSLKYAREVGQAILPAAAFPGGWTGWKATAPRIILILFDASGDCARQHCPYFRFFCCTTHSGSAHSPHFGPRNICPALASFFKRQSSHATATLPKAPPFTSP